jgi:hypothetical protein
LFAAVDDKSTVTVKDILLSLQAEYNCSELNKETRLAVRSCLTELINKEQQIQAEERQEEIEASEEEAADDSFDQDADDSLDEEFAPEKKSVPKPKNKKPTTRTKTSRTGSSAISAAKLRASALRIHAEQLRKKRIQELRVVNEEMQLHQSKQDAERASLIARKFDTNTAQLRGKRLQSRCNLLRKLDEKRLLVIHPTNVAAASVVKVEPNTAVCVDDNTETLVVEDLKENQSIQESDSEDDMELEIVAKSAVQVHSMTLPLPTDYFTDATSALSILDMPVAPPTRKSSPSSKKGSTALQPSPGRSMRARDSLMNQLRAKQRKISNLWLAKELGYKTEQEHLTDCIKKEKRKQRQTVEKEEERRRENELKLVRLLEFGEEDGDDDPEGGDNLEQEVEETEPMDDEEEDEEMALARAVATEVEANAVSMELEDQDELLAMDRSVDTKDMDASWNPRTSDDCGSDNIHGTVNEVTEFVGSAESDDDNGFETQLPFYSVKTSNDENDAPQPDLSDQGGLDNQDDEASSADTLPPPADDGSEEPETQPALSVKPNNGPRNAAWKAMLEKEAETVKRMKKRRGGLVEEEADEEEEENIIGLEDFGFTVNKKKTNEDDEEGADDVHDDDLENIVDELSDNEGDEDAGENARKSMERKEEKEKHKEMMRRMRDGYDGRRGGIAGGGGFGARGVHRFDELVAADNREDAKRLGLLNDDELDSDHEQGGDVPDEEEDEAAMLDAMLKDRFLHRSSTEEVEEQFSDEEQDIADDDAAGGVDSEELLEERMQERLARRFEKRARMQRLIENRGHENEFSQSRLIDEDTSLKIDLQNMKVSVSGTNNSMVYYDVLLLNSKKNGLARKRSQSSASSAASNGSKKQKTGPGLTSGVLMTGGSLAIALKASRRSKARTCFFRSGSGGCIDTQASVQKSVAVTVNHVVFHASESSQHSKGNAANTFRQPPGASGRFGAPSKSNSSSASLWSNAVVAGFQKQR